LGKLMKIAFVDQCLGTGGAERVMCTVIRSLDKERFETHLVLVSEEGPLKYLIPDGVKIRSLGVANTKKALFKFVQAMWDIRPEVVYVTSSRTAVLALLARFLCPRYRVIARYTSMPGKDIKEGSHRGWRLWLMKRLYRSADAVIAQTKEMAEELSQWFQISSKRIHQISNPVDGELIEQQLEGAANPFAGDAVNVVAAGTIYPVKGFDVLLDAFALVLKQNNRFRLHILGNDYQENRSKLEKRAEELGISAYVKFCGFLENPYPYYKFCDVFVLSSRCEALPNVLLECLYLGKPVVATRCAPVIERLVEAGKSGFTVDVENPEQMSRAILNYRQLSGGKVGRGENGIVRLIESVDPKLQA